MSLLVLRPLFFQRSAQTHQLKSISISYNGFVKLEQFVVCDILLIPPNIEHKLGAMDIRLCRGYWCMARLIPWLFSLCIVVSLFITNNDVKNLSIFAVGAIVYTWKNAFPDLLTSIHTVSNFLAFESFPMLSNIWK